MERTPVAAAIKEELGRRIAREWRAGERLPAVQELARQIGAGQRNTHRALRELADEGYLTATPGQGTFVKQNLDPVKLRERFGASVRSGVLGLRSRLHGKRLCIVSVHAGAGTHVGTTIDSATAALNEEGATVEVLAPPQRIGDVDLSPIEADGLLVMAWNLRLSRYRFSDTQAACFVTAGAPVTVAMPGRYDTIHSDAEQGGFLAGEHLRKLGHKRAIFLGRASTDGLGPIEETSLSRLRGFESGFGARIDPAHYLLATHYDDRTAARLLPAYLALKDRPAAIFAASDDLALGFIVGAAAHGLDFGKHYHIVGFDGQPRGQQIDGGPLTTVEAPHTEIGRRAAALLTSRLLDIHQPVRRVAIGCRLIEGLTALPAGSIG